MHPTTATPEEATMTDPEPFLGEIRMFAFDFAPRGWAPCDGRLLPINQNQALFSLLGNMYGGNGTTTFALPDLQSRVPINQGHGAGLSSYVVGQAGGTETVKLSGSDMLGAVGGGQLHSNVQPYLAVNFCIAMVGFFPARPDV